MHILILFYSLKTFLKKLNYFAITDSLYFAIIFKLKTAIDMYIIQKYRKDTKSFILYNI